MKIKVLEEYTTQAGETLELYQIDGGDGCGISCYNSDGGYRWDLLCAAGADHPFTEAEARAEFERWRT